MPPGSGRSALIGADVDLACPLRRRWSAGTRSGWSRVSAVTLRSIIRLHAVRVGVDERGDQADAGVVDERRDRGVLASGVDPRQSRVRSASKQYVLVRSRRTYTRASPDTGRRICPIQRPPGIGGAQECGDRLPQALVRVVPSLLVRHERHPPFRRSPQFFQAPGEEGRGGGFGAPQEPGGLRRATGPADDGSSTASRCAGSRRSSAPGDMEEFLVSHEGLAGESLPASCL